MSMVGDLFITDGTIRINLLTGIDGFYLQSWNPAIPGRKSTFRDSPLTDGRKPALMRWSNATETMSFSVGRFTQNDVIYDTQELRRLLLKAEEYFFGVVDTPVWLEARGNCETNTRYAVVVTWGTGNDSDPYNKPFDLDHPVMTPWTLTLERQHWRHIAPGTDSAVKYSAQQVYNGVTYGRAATTALEVYVANKHNNANITDFYFYDAAPAGFSPNLIGGALPIWFLPPVPAAGDIVYFGCNTAIANSGPFSSLVFDINNASNNLTGWVWEYWNGAWVALTVRDNTVLAAQVFRQTGVNSVHWVQQPDWVPTAINGVTAYWVRCRITGVGAGPTPPSQRNRDVYTVVTPYLEIASSEVAGDIPSLVKMIFEGIYGNGGTLLGTQRLLMGLRSFSRGGDTFRAYINLADEQNNPSVNAYLNAAAVCVFATDTETPSGRVASWTTGAAAPETWICYVDIASSIGNDYIGRYRCLLRFKGNTMNLGDLFRLQLWSGEYTNIIWQSNLLAPDPLANRPLVIDFGVITFPPTAVATGLNAGHYGLRLNGVAANIVNYELWDFILIPADECLIEASANPQVDSGAIYNAWTMLDNYPAANKYLYLDSTKPREQIIANIAYYTDSIATYSAHISGPMIYNPNEKQRWHIFQARSESLADVYWVSYPSLTLRANGYHVDRYLSMRGAR